MSKGDAPISYGAGDAIRIGEGTSAVLRGKQVAYEILGFQKASEHILQKLKKVPKMYPRKMGI